MRRTEEEIMKLVDEIANYIIETESSTRLAAKEFGVSNYTVSTYMSKRLPENDSRYSKIQRILSLHQQTVDKDITQTRLKTELSLLLGGKHLDEIAQIMKISLSQVSRDFSERLPMLPQISVETLEYVRKLLSDNSLGNLQIGNDKAVEQQRDSKGKFR